MVSNLFFDGVTVKAGNSLVLVTVLFYIRQSQAFTEGTPHKAGVYPHFSRMKHLRVIDHCSPTDGKLQSITGLPWAVFCYVSLTVHG